MKNYWGNGEKSMKNLVLVVLLGSYSIGSNFNLAGFFTSALASGVKLSAATRTDSPNGYITMASGKIHVYLYSVEVAAVTTPTNQQQAGNAVLPNAPSTYESAVSAAVTANNP